MVFLIYLVYGDGNINNQDIWGVLLKEYTYLLTI